MGIKHPSHEHWLARCEKEGEVSCGVCKQPIHGSAYGCDQEGDCSYFLHLSCTKVNHPLHPEHPLAHSEEKLLCDLCRLKKDPIFACASCWFDSCEDCVSLEPCVAFECKQGHFVLIARTAFLIGDLCLNCGEAPDDTMIFHGSEGFFHVHCVPFGLPKSVKHPDHHHRLTFTEECFDPDIIVCFCSICKDKRYHKSPVYHCSECKFSAHSACALSAVLPLLTAEWRAGGHGRGDSVWKSETQTSSDQEQLLKRLYRKRALQRYYLEALTEELKTVEEEYDRFLAFAGESGADDHE